MDHWDLISIPIEGGEELSDKTQPLPMCSLDELIDRIDKAINTEYNKQTRQLREETVRGTRRKMDNLTCLNDYAETHATSIIDTILTFFYTEDLDSAINEGLFRKLRAKNPLLDQAINYSVKNIHEDFTRVTPEKLDCIDDPCLLTQFAQPIAAYIMEYGKNRFKTTNYWLQYSPQSSHRPSVLADEKPSHDLYLCLQAIENAKKASSLNYVYGAHQFKQLNLDQQNDIVRPEIEKKLKQLGYHAEKPSSPTY
jgi:hypothetical protein